MSETMPLMERAGTTPADIVAATQESHALAVVPVERDPYAGIASTRVTKEQETTLLRESKIDELDILPTGEVYMSQVEYRRRLNSAFGPGGWALRPLGKPTVMGNTLMQEWALYAEGRFIGSAWGEHDYHKNNDRSSYATAAEALKSNALTRCCKDLGIAAECWDRRFTAKFKKEHCVKVWRSKSGRNKSGEYQWRRKDAEAFYDEGRNGRNAEPEQAPDDTDPSTGEVVSEKPPQRPTNTSNASAFIDRNQQKALIEAGKKSGWSGADFSTWLKQQGYGEWSKIPVTDYSSVLSVMEHGTGGAQ
jgi:hypothetical protein